MEDTATQQPLEIEMLRSALGLRDNEICMLRGELDRSHQAQQMLMLSMERLEKTMAACYDRLLRKVDRLGGHHDDEQPLRKRRRK
jgi:hypothetical protein